MSNTTITSAGTYTLSQPLTNGQNIEFLNDGGTINGVLILTDNPQGSAFNVIPPSGSITTYAANIGPGSILNFEPGYLDEVSNPGDQVTIQAVKDLFVELFPGSTANSDYISLVDDITTAAHNGNQFLILPSGTVEVTAQTPFTLDAAQNLAISEVGAALFGTAAAADGATLDIAFGLRTSPNSNTPFVDAIITTDTAINPCFAAGTHILALRGEIPIEELEIGDILLTHAGEEHSIIWIGRREIDIATHSRPETVRPIIIEPGALGENTPARRLTLSPDHALFLDEVLVPAKELLNWTSIRQDPATRKITYYHLELEQHDIIFAEGTPVETYLDTGHRAIFDNAESQIIAHPTLMQQRRESESCAPLCLTGPILAAIRHRIAARQVGVRLG